MCCLSRFSSLFHTFWCSRLKIILKQLFALSSVNIGEYLLEGPEGVKWELGFAYFCTGKMGFGLLGKCGLGYWDWELQTQNWEWETCLEIAQHM